MGQRIVGLEFDEPSPGVDGLGDGPLLAVGQGEPVPGDRELRVDLEATFGSKLIGAI